jgi:hypothetical protein
VIARPRPVRGSCLFPYGILAGQIVMDKREIREYNPFMPFIIKRILRQNES